MNRAYIVCGSPGAGKTVYGKKLAERTGAALLDIDGAKLRDWDDYAGYYERRPPALPICWWIIPDRKRGRAAFRAGPDNQPAPFPGIVLSPAQSLFTPA